MNTKTKSSRRLMTTLCVAVLLSFAGSSAFAQGLSFFQPAKGTDKKRAGKVPTVINSDVMDIDIPKNIAVFSGNVKVDDEEMTITCKKMTIFLEDKKSEASTAPATPAKKTEPAGEAAPEESKQISRIICEQDVVIIRKAGDDKEKAEGEQKAVAGHADYDVKTGKIVLTKDPILQRGQGNVIKGEIIVLWRDSEKLEVHQRGEITLSNETIETGKDKNPAP